MFYYQNNQKAYIISLLNFFACFYLAVLVHIMSNLTCILHADRNLQEEPLKAFSTEKVEKGMV